MHDAPHGHPDMHWPSGFTPQTAHTFCQARAVISSSPDRVFALLTDMARWPEWVPGITEVRLGPHASAFEVELHDHRFEVIIGERAEPRRLGWSGIGAGVQLYQAWLLTEVGDKTHVVTEAVVRGPAAKSIGALSPTWAERLNARWLAQLKRLAETAPEATAR
ncbi:SRPBCC family protein [Streptomyces anthocyanicus]|uniref:SRPBCC family protein n=1 Tax=Streptomyces anthocyanicus TaxID=68174 RepID=UPI002F90D2D7|nr:SRPBCC family protein [Streptomyces anthocyanicus]